MKNIAYHLLKIFFFLFCYSDIQPSSRNPTFLKLISAHVKTQRKPVLLSKVLCMCHCLSPMSFCSNSLPWPPQIPGHWRAPTGFPFPVLRPRNSLQAESWDSYGTHLLCFPFRCSLPYATCWLMSKNCCFIYSVLFCNSFMKRYKPGSFCSVLAGNKSLPSEHIYLIVMVSIWKAHFRHWLFHIKWFCYIDFT